MKRVMNLTDNWKHGTLPPGLGRVWKKLRIYARNKTQTLITLFWLILSVEEP